MRAMAAIGLLHLLFARVSSGADQARSLPVAAAVPISLRGVPPKLSNFL
jgi:hypothetical protein